MRIQLLAFAQTRLQLGFGEKLVDCTGNETPREILKRIVPEFEPGPVRVAVNQTYADWDHPIGEATEIALIPPVSGG